MSTEKTYRVLREMHGERAYAPGDTRQLEDHDAAHLLAFGVIELVEAAAPDTKPAPAPRNKKRQDAETKAE